ncbi:ABC transporter ATP-binding protein [Anaerobranca gottschalkii]|uniref:Peptide/nickel transport system ATP-binding protein n=1 Tax=Anaerobranca gottschalkii DSM 13577 TaxID=1120990 RepID=A0A1H9YHL6_9FIRM|nr:ABC transporter ATP-binding protein [Anaerobranca gottschalkii]SES68538.1 peptide/nickel transport system ATP-binding protein [Anaerobranca gottschalkii DSM 13577]
MRQKLVELVNVNKIFSKGFIKKNHKIVLEDINLELFSGDRLVIIGESGMGKTTLARIMVNLEPKSKGDIYWMGKNINKLSSKEKKELSPKIQYVHQDPYGSLHPSKTIFKILADPLKKNEKIVGKNLYNKTLELMEKVGLSPADYYLNKYPHHLSGGGRQRLAIARSLTTNPQVIVADEPISMIDMSLRTTIIELFKELNNEDNLAIVLILHDIGAAKFFTYEKGDVIILYGGKIVEKGRGIKILSNPKHPYTKVLINSTPIVDPELAKNRKIEQLRSYEVPIRTPESKGCPFSHACNQFAQKCLEENPKLKKIEDNHEVACHFC